MLTFEIFEFKTYRNLSFVEWWNRLLLHLLLCIIFMDSILVFVEINNRSSQVISYSIVKSYSILTKSNKKLPIIKACLTTEHQRGENDNESRAPPYFLDHFGTVFYINLWEFCHILLLGQCKEYSTYC